MATVAHIVDSFGQPGKLKLKRCREHEAAGRGAWVDGVFVFVRRPETVQRLRTSPTVGRVTMATALYPDIHTCGYSLLPYPQKSGVSGGFAAQYPGLARRGAGL